MKKVVNHMGEFERHLKDLIGKGEIAYPLTDEMLEAVLDTIEPEELSGEFSERLLSAMRAAHERRRRVEAKLANISDVTSFGEYIHLSRLQSRMSIKDASAVAGVDHNVITKLEDDALPIIPSLAKELSRIAKWLLNLSFEDTVMLLRKTVRLQAMGSQRDLAATYARADSKMDELQRTEVLRDATNKLLLALGEDRGVFEKDSNWQSFVRELRREMKK